jgi:hypothetical protein
MELNASPQELSEQVSNAGSVYSCFCDLGELIQDTLYFLHSPVKVLTREALLSLYTRYLGWYGGMPEVLRLGQNSTPAVLFAHMCYHFAILHLFRPFHNLRLLESTISPTDTSRQAADAIQALLKSYSQLYTLRRTPSLVPYLALGSAILHFDLGAVATTAKAEIVITSAATSHPVLEAVGQDIVDLRQMTVCHQAAEQALDLLGYHATMQSIDIGIRGDKALVDDYQRLVRPYMNDVSVTARRLRRQDFLPLEASQFQ